MLKIIPAYLGIASYIEKARAYHGIELVPLWERHVIAPYWDQWAAGQHNETRIRQDLLRPILDLDGLEQEINVLATSPVEAIVSAVYEQICELLPYHEEDAAVCIMAADPADRGLVDHLNGVVGSCVGGNTLLTINPAGKDWQKMVPYVLAHERHHSAWGYHHFYIQPIPNPDFLASLINEGSADSFARLLCPDVHPKWIEALSPEQEILQWRSIQEVLHQSDGDGALYQRFFFGNPETGTPAYAGYTIGYHIVQSYLKTHPHESVADLDDAHPRENPLRKRVLI